jgi:hypothetical protein
VRGDPDPDPDLDPDPDPQVRPSELAIHGPFETELAPPSGSTSLARLAVAPPKKGAPHEIGA